ncbi:MAG: MCE family protein [Alphaproteobacteria bacterium]|jgi:phospholipid/cholesterol/gamma-HCH transport system substrate-binding protein|nr:MCE family protein [Alphaproteobacteria bacterium]
MNTAAHREVRDVIVGLCVSAVVVVAMVLVFGPSLFAGTSTYQVQATFERTDGLMIGNPVQAAGVTVGKVTAMDLVDGFRVRTTLQIDVAVELDSEASAAIVTDGIFGGKLVLIDIGGGSDVIEGGGEIRFTEDAVVLDDLFGLIISQARSNRDIEATERSR